MARVIANNKTVIKFGPVDDLEDITNAEISEAEDLTGFMTSFDNSTEGNEVDTPDFANEFETSIPGTYSASISAEFYRDDENDTAWDTLPRGTEGVFIIARFGLDEGNPLELYPARVTSRSPVALANNESQRFEVSASVPEPPNEDATVPAST